MNMNTQINVQMPVSTVLDRAEAKLTSAQTNLTKARTFMSDILEEHFEKYEFPTQRDTSTLTFIWYSLVHYVNYAKAVADYIDNAASIIEYACHSVGDAREWVKSMGDTLSGGVSNE